MIAITTSPLDFAYDEDTFADAAQRVEEQYAVRVDLVAEPAPVQALHGAWPLVTFTGHPTNIVRFMRDAYTTGDAESDLDTLRAAFGVGLE